MQNSHSPSSADTLDSHTRNQILFDGLVYNEAGAPAWGVWIGGVGHYAIPDGSINWHVEAYHVDHAVIETIKEQLSSQQDDVTRTMIEMLGKDDIFTKAAIDASMRNLEQSIRRSDNSQWVPWLKLLGFRVVVDFRGSIVEILYPNAPPEDE